MPSNIEHLKARIDNKRRQITERMADGDYVKSYGASLTVLAELEGILHAVQSFSIIADKPDEYGANDLRMMASSMIREGAQDTYSGRENDIQRAFFDGVRKVAADVLFHGELNVDGRYM